MNPTDQKNYMSIKLERQINADTLNEASRLIIKAALYIDRVSNTARLPEQDINELDEISLSLQKSATRMIELGEEYVSDTRS